MLATIRRIREQLDEGRYELLALLAEIPEGHAHCRPCPQVLSLWDLLLHVVASDRYYVNVIRTGDVRGEVHVAGERCRTRADLHALMQETRAEVHALLETMTEQELGRLVHIPARLRPDFTQRTELSVEHIWMWFVRHDAYHAGQIALLGRLIAAGITKPQ